MPSKKHFEAIAKILNAAPAIPHYLDSSPDAVRAMIARDIASYFESQNIRFDRSRFLKACGLEVTQ